MSSRRPEDPVAILERAYAKQIEALEDLRRAIADVFVSEKRLEIERNRIGLAQNKARVLAADAIARGDDGAGGAALERVANGAAESEQFLAEIAKMRAQRDALQQTADDITAHVASMRSQKSALVARMTAARAGARVAQIAPPGAETADPSRLWIEREIAALKASETERERWVADDPIDGRAPQRGP